SEFQKRFKEEFLVQVTNVSNINNNLNSSTNNDQQEIPKGVTNTVKILATGELTKALKIEGLKVSDAAKVKIEKAGGTIS
ncbi:MAG: uL15 family ribosomal protein, partial [Candidatus Pacebacteria bacterium]|nr:uL15 family ribosomal protein [Candidatus Paceibacterota bacterium]